MRRWDEGRGGRVPSTTRGYTPPRDGNTHRCGRSIAEANETCSGTGLGRCLVWKPIQTVRSTYSGWIGWMVHQRPKPRSSGRHASIHSSSANSSAMAWITQSPSMRRVVSVILRTSDIAISTQFHSVAGAATDSGSAVHA